jgi:hypothetical protein
MNYEEFSNDSRELNIRRPTDDHSPRKYKVVEESYLDPVPKTEKPKKPE